MGTTTGTTPLAPFLTLVQPPMVHLHTSFSDVRITTLTATKIPSMDVMTSVVHHGLTAMDVEISTKTVGLTTMPRITMVTSSKAIGNKPWTLTVTALAITTVLIAVQCRLTQTQGQEIYSLTSHHSMRIMTVTVTVITIQIRFTATIVHGITENLGETEMAAWIRTMTVQVIPQTKGRSSNGTSHMARMFGLLTQLNGWTAMVMDSAITTPKTQPTRTTSNFIQPLQTILMAMASPIIGLRSTMAPMQWGSNWTDAQTSGAIQHVQ